MAISTYLAMWKQKQHRSYLIQILLHNFAAFFNVSLLDPLNFRKQSNNNIGSVAQPCH